MRAETTCIHEPRIRLIDSLLKQLIHSLSGKSILFDGSKIQEAR